MASPFHRKKKERRRMRKRAQACAAWADEHERLGDKLPLQITGMRSSAEDWAQMAQVRRKAQRPPTQRS
jgi:hypothetical protein